MTERTRTVDPVSFKDALAYIDQWLDDSVAMRYRREPMAQDWARVAKVAEEAGEAIEALISWTGQNPRKPQRDEAREELLEELADVAATGILAMQHFTKDADETWTRLEDKIWMIEKRARNAV